MNPERYQRIMQILGEALEREPESRDVWLNVVCGGDEPLRVEVARLLARQKPAAHFLEESPLAVAVESNGRSMIGERVGLYKIVSEIGRGGMGAVYLAERDDAHFTRRVALKLIKRGMDTDFVVQRFRHERQILASLDHPNIAGLIDGGTTEADLPYFIMEYVEGQPITEYANEHSLTTSERLKLFRTVCSAVQYAHQNLVIHRDLKPSNILVTKDGEPKLLDFGIAKLLQADGGAETELTATAVRVMTPEYASPEQVKGERVTTSTDVYSLGVLFYELLTGHRPYRLKTRQPEEIVKAICEQQPEKPSLAVSGQWSVLSDQKEGDSQPSPDHGHRSILQSAIINPKSLRGDLDNIVLMALRKEPHRRYASAEQLSEDIRRHLEGLPVIACKATVSYRAAKFVQRNKIGVTAAAIILLTLIGGIIGTAWEAHKARVQSARAEQRFNEARELAHSVLFDYHDAIASLPGSTPVRERLVKDALKYLDKLATDPGTSQSLQRELATAYLKVGDVQGRPYASNLGQTEGALTSYQKARAILEPLLATDKGDKDLRRDVAAVYERIGNIELRNGHFNEALESQNKALTMRQALLLTGPRDKNYRGELADSYLYVGDALQVDCHELECERQALEDQRQALEIRQALAKEDPADLQMQRNIAQAYSRIGFRLATINQTTGDKKYLRDWLDSDEAALQIRKQLAAVNSTNALDRRNLADQLMLTGNAQLGNEDIAGALKSYRDSIEIFKGLYLSDPANSEASRDLSFVYFRLARANDKAGHVPEARNNYAEVIRISQQLLATDATNEEDLRNAYATYVDLSKLSEREADLERAIEHWSKVVDLMERIVSITPENKSHLYEKQGTYYQMALLHARAGGAQVTNWLLDEKIPPRPNLKQRKEWREARNWFQKSLDVLQNMKSKGMLSNDYVDSSDRAVKEIARCDAALKVSK